MHSYDLTFIIPLRLDSLHRLENILFVSHFLISNFNANLKIIEFDTQNNGLLEKRLNSKIKYEFIKDNDPIFFRTKYINRMVMEVETPFVAVWDSDVILPIQQLKDAVNLLRNEKADFVYPYERYFYDTSFILRKLYFEDKNLDLLLNNTKKMQEMYAPNPVGGAFLANVKTYINSGLENEDFYGWGLEDGERFYRWQNKGYRIKRVEGPMFHLSHGRGMNSIYHNTDQQIYKQKEIRAEIRKKNI